MQPPFPDSEFGVGLDVYLNYCERNGIAGSADDMKTWTADSPIVATLYREHLWTPLRCDLMPPAVGVIVASAGCAWRWPCAARLLNEAVGLPSAYVVTGRTLAAVRSAVDHRVTVESVHLRKVAFYSTQPACNQYGHLWMRTAEAVREVALTPL